MQLSRLKFLNNSNLASFRYNAQLPSPRFNKNPEYRKSKALYCIFNISSEQQSSPRLNMNPEYRESKELLMIDMSSMIING